MNTRGAKLAASALGRDAFQWTGAATSRVHAYSHKGAVYTAFDGDDFYFTDLFSKHAFNLGWIPINPEACLGYKQAVDSLHTKSRVLTSDVALLGKVDQLWIYTSQSASAPVWSELPEGVLVEALYWLTLGPDRHRPIFFVDLPTLMMRGKSEPRQVEVTADFLRSAITQTHPEVIELVDDLHEPGVVPPVVVAAYHIADSKNAHWLREWMLTQGWTPVVPTLAFPSSSVRGVSDLSASWLFAIEVADIVLWLDPLDGRDEGWFSSHLRKVRVAEHDLRGNWSAVGAPKAVKGKAWPISTIERDALRAPVRLSPWSRKS